MIDTASIEQYGVLDGDCFEIMKDIKPNSIDCVVAAPYLSYNAEWSDDRLAEFFSRAKDVLVETGSIILLHEITGPYKDRRDMIPKIAEKLGLVRQHDMTYWHYTKGDYFYRGYNSPANIAYEKPDEQYEVAEDDKSTFILCHAPQLLMDIAASTYTPPGGIVLDPMCGNGTVLISALQRRRRALGIEIIPEIASKARERIDKYLEYARQID